MTQEEKQIVLKECNDKLEEIDFQRTKNEEYWEQYYNKHYRKMFLVEDILDRVLHSGFTGLVVVGSGMALYHTGHSVALSVGVPVGGYIAVGLTDLIITFKSVHKKKDYWGQLRHHTEVQDQLEFSKYPYRIISGYLKEGDKSLLHQYRIHGKIISCTDMLIRSPSAAFPFIFTRFFNTGYKYASPATASTESWNPP